MSAWNFERSYSAGALQYLEEFSSAINLCAYLVGVSPLGIAASIAREITAYEEIYEFGGSTTIYRLGDAARGAWLSRGAFLSWSSAV